MPQNEKTNTEFRYYAFLSYSHSDKPWADRLHQFLETYRVPKDLVNQPNRDGVVPKRLFPIFRDREELPTSSDLGSALHEALDTSRYLIVICSPRAAVSRFVNEEIRYFKALGREDHILCMIVDGEPNATDKPDCGLLECFPPALRFRVNDAGELTQERAEPIAADIRPEGDGRRNAFLKITAGVLGVNFDDLYQRDKKRQKRKQIAWTLAAVFFLTLASGSLFAWWDYTRTKTRYYAQLVWRWGVPEGIFTLTKDQFQHLGKRYRVESSRKKVRRVIYENSAGVPSPDKENHQATLLMIHYRDNGKIESIDFFDRNNRMILKKNYSQDLSVVEYKRDEQEKPITMLSQDQGYISNDLRNRNLRTDIEKEKVTYDTGGFLRVVMYQNHWGNPSYNADGIYGRKNVYNKDGQLIREQYLDKNEKEIATSNGLFYTINVYDVMGNWIQCSYFGIDGNPIFHKDGFTEWTRKYDGYGNQTEFAFFGLNRKPILIKYGYAKIISRYDEHGNGINSAYFGVDGNSILCNNGYAKYAPQFDEQGNQVGCAYFGVDGNPILTKGGVAKWMKKYDKRGNEIEYAYFDVDGKPILRKDGYAKWTAKYDDRGNQIERAFFGVNGEPILIIYGYAKWIRKYDERDNEIECAYFGVYGNPISIEDGYAKRISKYDERDNEIECSYYGADGNPIRLEKSHAKWIKKYDEHGNQIECSAFGVDGNPTLCNEGWAKMTCKYDEKENLSEVAYFGLDGKPKNDIYGCAKWTNKHDDRGNHVECAFFGEDGNPILHKKERCAKWIKKYDDRGNAIDCALFGVDGKPIQKND